MCIQERGLYPQQLGALPPHLKVSIPYFDNHDDVDVGNASSGFWKTFVLGRFHIVTLADLRIAMLLKAITTTHLKLHVLIERISGWQETNQVQARAV